MKKFLNMKRQEIFNLILVLAISLIFSTFFISINFETFDYFTHIFFAQHYRENWFSLVDYKLGGGLDLSTYPPLTHQLIALLSFILPFSVSYYSILLIFWVLLSFFSAKFLLDYLEVKNMSWLAYILIFCSTGIIITIFVFGQITTIVGLAFGFISLYWFNQFLGKGRSIDMILSSLSLVLCAFSHHLSFLLISVFYFLIFLFEWRRIFKKSRHFILFFILSTLLISTIYYTPIQKGFEGSLIPTREIPHWSREPFATPLNFHRWLLMYGTSIFMLFFPLLMIILKNGNRKQQLKLYFIALTFLLLGLGRTTPISTIFFSLEYWLTYERFSLMASIILTVFFVFFIPSDYVANFSNKKIKVNIFLIIFLAFYVFINIQALFRSHSLFFANPTKHPDTDRQEITAYVLNFLNYASPNYRYQTFGYGRPIGELYTQTNIPTLDADYFTGRTIDWIKNSGIDEIDQADDKSFLDKFLNHTQEYSVKYIITFTDFYHQYMRSHNWKILETKKFNGREIIIWENPNELMQVSKQEEKISLPNYLWGIVPLLIFFIFLSLTFKYKCGDLHESLLHFSLSSKQRISG